jgi:hypothetical protein
MDTRENYTFRGRACKAKNPGGVAKKWAKIKA